MISFFKKLFSRFRSTPIDTPLSSYRPSIHQEDTRTTQAIKNVRKAFIEQAKELQARALKPHSASCSDPLTCSKEKCFEPEPDKIVSQPYKVSRRWRKKKQVESQEKYT